MKKRGTFIILAILIFFSFSFVSSQPFGYNNLEPSPCVGNEIRVANGNCRAVGEIFSNNTGSVNSSEFWLTNIGALGDVNTTQFSNNGGFLNIIESWVRSLAVNPFDQDLNTTSNVQFSNLSIINEGRVGIGTTTAQNDLDIRNVNGANVSLTRIDDAVVGDDLIGQILWLSNDSSNTDSKVAGYIRLLADTNWGGANPEGMIEFGTSTSGTPVATHMTIDKTGEVTLTQDLMVDGGNIGLTIDPNLLTLANESLTVRGTYSVVSPDVSTNIFDLSSSVGITLMAMRETGGSEGTFAMRNAANTVVFNLDSGASTVNFFNAGDVGIGTTTPANLLNVVGDGNFTADLYVQDDLFVFDQVGIGTTTPLINLHVITSGSSGLGSTPANRGIAITGISGQSRIYLEATDAPSSERVFMIESNGGLLRFGSLNDTASAFTNENILILDHDTGNVGIGTTSPATKLHLPQLQ